MTRRIPLAPISAALVALAASAGLSIAQAQQGSRTEYDSARQQARQQYDMDRKSCDSLGGNAKDVCREQAKVERVKREAQAEAAYKGTPDAQREAQLDIAKAEHKLAKEKCDDLSGNSKDVCEKDADAAYTTAKENAKLAEKTHDAARDAVENKAESRADAQRERCDTLSGAAKDACESRADAQQNPQSQIGSPRQ